jgi:hypothetical protein
MYAEVGGITIAQTFGLHPGPKKARPDPKNRGMLRAPFGPGLEIYKDVDLSNSDEVSKAIAKDQKVGAKGLEARGIASCVLDGPRRHCAT